MLLAPRAVLAHGDSAAPRPDVLVVGGTPSGVAAAIAAARRGERVTLVSAGHALGGILVDSLLDQWDLNVTEDGASVQAGIFSEIYHALGQGFEPQAAARLFAEMVAAEPRIAVIYGEVPVGVVSSRDVDGRTIGSVMFRNVRSNTTTFVRAPLVIDATDFADVAAMAGARFDLGRQDTGIDDDTQAVTEIFTLDGVDWQRVAGSYDPARFGPGGAFNRSVWGYAKLMREYRPQQPGIVVRDLNLAAMQDGGVSVNAVDVVGIDGLVSSQRDLAKRRTIAEAPELVEFLRSRVPGFEHARVGRFAPEVYVRETRHVAGAEKLTALDVWLGRIPSDSVGLASYPLDTHPVDATDEPAFAAVRHVYGVPLGTLLPNGFANLILASPAISATHLAAGSARTVPTTIEEGEAAGAAAALASREHVDFVRLWASARRVLALRMDLVENGAIVGAPFGEATLAAGARAGHGLFRTTSPQHRPAPG